MAYQMLLVSIGFISLYSLSKQVLTLFVYQLMAVGVLCESSRTLGICVTFYS